MLWMDYMLESFPDGSFTVRGEWPGEVMGLQKDGSPKNNHLYKPGDVFVVDENGVLRKSDELMVFIQKGLEHKNVHSDNNSR